MAVMKCGDSEFQRHVVREASPLGPDEVSVKTTHCGLCHTDLSLARNQWASFAPATYPFVGGHEAVGVVEAVGPSVASLKPGDRVGVGFLRSCCRSCPRCLAGEDNLCPGFVGTCCGGGRGGFSSRLRVAADFAFKIPDEISSAEAAPLLCAGVTVYAPLERALRPGMRVAVLGLGGLGHLAVQFASKMGAGAVVAVGRPEDSGKADDMRRLGADELITVDQLQPDSCDIVMNTTWSPCDAGALMCALAPGGLLVQLGMPWTPGATGTQSVTLGVDLLSLVPKQRRVAGSNVGSRAVTARMLAFAAKKGIRPLVEVLPLAKINDAVAKMDAGEQRYRIVLSTARKFRQEEGGSSSSELAEE